MSSYLTNLLASLNDVQREAVTAPLTPLLILAGAGTGKTRVLVNRMAYLVLTNQTRPYNLLALTFTNKAAIEMQTRLSEILETNPNGLWTGTFHGIANRFLRIHTTEAKLPANFPILDSDDQLRTVKRVIRVLNLDEKVYTPKQAQYFINECKELGLRSKAVETTDNIRQTNFNAIYALYEEICLKCGLVDFSELLLRTYELLRDNPELLNSYRERFHHVFVDEFQDTNTIQYLFLQLLIGKENYLFAVGDDDQSIYGWRGAKMENIQYFSRDFPNTRMIRLEQNYRSTQTILYVANHLISKNQVRLGKNLWTDGFAGSPIYLYQAFDETDEANYVVHQIANQTDCEYCDCAILYRTGAQSRSFEEKLLACNIPYKIYGSFRFYERAEVKDVLAHLRLIVLHDDDAAFERIVNTPKRGIGEKTLTAIRSEARRFGISLWSAAISLLENQVLPPKANNNLAAFIWKIEQFAEQVQYLSLEGQIHLIINESGLIEHYHKATHDEATRRLENLAELVTAAHNFMAELKNGDDPITAFLTHASLASGEKQSSQFDNCVQLMSLHLAKGLEFKKVFLCGLEDGLLPHATSINEGNLEEERRLCYVGITRARQQLYFCYAESRYQYGERTYGRASRFLWEIPRDLIEEVRFNVR